MAKKNKKKKAAPAKQLKKKGASRITPTVPDLVAGKFVVASSEGDLLTHRQTFEAPSPTASALFDSTAAADALTQPGYEAPAKVVPAAKFFATGYNIAEDDNYRCILETGLGLKGEATSLKAALKRHGHLLVLRVKENQADIRDEERRHAEVMKDLKTDLARDCRRLAAFEQFAKRYVKK